MTEPGGAQLFRDLAWAEEAHLAMLRKLFEDLAGHPAGEEFPSAVIDLDPREEAIMEGGISVRKALAWAGDKTLREVLEMAIGIETVAYDRYLFMLERLQGKQEQEVFRALAGVEQRHLDTVSARLDELVGAAKVAVS